MTSLIQNLFLPVLVIAGLIVLTALHDVDASVTVPIIAGLAGVHVGANIASPGSTNSASKPSSMG